MSRPAEGGSPARARPAPLATACIRRAIVVSLLVSTGVAAGIGGVASAADAPELLTVTVERTSGEPVAGRLVAIDADAIRLAGDEGEATVPLTTVRRVVRVGGPAARPRAVELSTLDGGELQGDDFVRAGDEAVVTIGDSQARLPMDRVRSVAWTAGGTDWLADLPAEPSTDLVVVRRDDGHELVECAVSGVDSEHVTVSLDGETIPVKRTKVAGIVWLRPAAAPAGGTQVVVAGGRLAAGGVAWTDAGLVLDGVVRLPAALLESIDYAAGRTVPLAGLDTERTDVEPFFGGLAEVEGIARFFAPRATAATDGPAGLAIRPRTVAVWRVPADSRRFRAAIEREVATGPAAVEVTLALDDRELFRRRIDGAAGEVPIDVDVAGGRRLSIVVDFVPGDVGCAVRFLAPAFEK